MKSFHLFLLPFVLCVTSCSSGNDSEIEKLRVAQENLLSAVQQTNQELAKLNARNEVVDLIHYFEKVGNQTPIEKKTAAQLQELIVAMDDGKSTKNAISSLTLCAEDWKLGMQRSENEISNNRGFQPIKDMAAYKLSKKPAQKIVACMPFWAAHGPLEPIGVAIDEDGLIVNITG